MSTVSRVFRVGVSPLGFKHFSYIFDNIEFKGLRNKCLPQNSSSRNDWELLENVIQIRNPGQYKKK